MRGAALLALVQAADRPRRGELARALWSRARPHVGAARDREEVFDVLGFAPHVPPDDAAFLLRRAIETLAIEPYRPEILCNGFGHDLLHLLPLIARVAGEPARARVLAEVEELSTWLP